MGEQDIQLWTYQSNKHYHWLFQTYNEIFKIDSHVDMNKHTFL
jgi:hypothetical protein